MSTELQNALERAYAILEKAGKGGKGPSKIPKGPHPGIRRVIDFKEQQHPRDPSGKFIRGAGVESGGKVHQAHNPTGFEKAFKDSSPNQQREVMAGILNSSSKGELTPRDMVTRSGFATGSIPDREHAASVASTVDRMVKQGHAEVVLTQRAVKGSGGKIEREADGSPKMTDVYTVKLTEKGKADFAQAKVDLKHSGDIKRPVKLDPVATGEHAKWQASREAVYPNTKAGVMGRQFSSMKTAPEMTHKASHEDIAKWQATVKGTDKAKLKEALKVPREERTPEQHQMIDSYSKANAELNAIKGKLSREDVFSGDKSRGSIVSEPHEFFDGTSSVNGIIGVMTGNKQMLANSKLILEDQRFGHEAVLQKHGIDPADAHKPYFANTLSHADGTSMKPEDFPGLPEGAAGGKILKKASKAIFTPGTYGSNVREQVIPAGVSVRPGKDGPALPKEYEAFMASDAANNAVKELVKGGMKQADAVKAASAMVKNYISSPIAKFNESFGDIMAHAPAGFVYTNPVSGFKMNFEKFTTKGVKSEGAAAAPTLGIKKSITVKNPDGTSGTAAVTFPHVGGVDAAGTKRGVSALFVQNWDAAAMASISLGIKSPHTLHDAIAIPKSIVSGGNSDKLNEQVADAYNKIAKADPVNDMGHQIRQAIQASSSMTVEQKSKQLASLDKALHNFNTGVGKFGAKSVKIPKKNRHFVPD